MMNKSNQKNSSLKGCRKILLGTLLVLCLFACKSPNNIWYKANVSPSLTTGGGTGGGSVHDTIYQSNIKYDSIYLDNTLYVDRSGDTVYIRENHLQYKYKVIRDTVYYHKTDTVSQIIKQSTPSGWFHSLSAVKTTWFKWLIALVVIGIILMVLIKKRLLNLKEKVVFPR